jgi:hypothetical protein
LGQGGGVKEVKGRAFIREKKNQQRQRQGARGHPIHTIKEQLQNQQQQQQQQGWVPRAGT